MRSIHILTVHETKSEVYLFPLRVHQQKLKRAGLDFQYHYQILPETIKADWVIVDCRWARERFGSRKDEMSDFLRAVRKSCRSLAWLDTTASTSVGYPDVLPYVDLYFKGLLLKDRREYLKPHYSNRIFADYYFRTRGIRDSREPPSLVVSSESHLPKLRVLWNYSLAGFFGSRARMFMSFRRFVPIPSFYSIPFASPERTRPLDISCRLNLDYSQRESISFQRREVIRLLEAQFAFPKERISRRRYEKEIRDAKIVPSPFGAGEINYRDFEVLAGGAALVKPDMGHLETWPDLFRKDETYICHAWDLSDVVGQIRRTLETGRYLTIARRAQDLYRKHLFQEDGQAEFCDRALRLFGHDDRESGAR